ncbi:MAG TPA: hypothetical protein VGD73_29755 [Pseudonocardia sp.]
MEPWTAAVTERRHADDELRVWEEEGVLSTDAASDIWMQLNS